MENPHERENFSLIGYARSTPKFPNIIRRPLGFDPWMLELTMEGEVSVQSPDSKVLTFTKGDIFCYRSRTPQTYELKSGCKKWCHYWICFYPTETCLNLMDWDEPFEGFLTTTLSDHTILERMEVVFKETITVSGSHYPLRQDLMDNLLEQMLLWVKMENRGSSKSALDERIRKSLYHIDDSIQRYIKVEELARIAGLSVSRFAHLFQETMGLSPSRYIERRRMERAIEFLLATAEPVSWIANKVGYEDPLYFSRVFRRTVGESPQNYRSSTKKLPPSQRKSEPVEI